jgi:hypothetical protein
MRGKKGTVLSACLALALLCAVPRAGAQYRFSGTVLAMDSVPVANAIMQLRVEGAPARNLATKTDAAGRFFFDLLTGVEAVENTNGNFEPAQGFPNPFTDGTSLRFSLPQPGAVRLAICDLLGRALRVLTDGFSPAGTRIVPWDGRDATGARVPPGLYFAVLQTEQRTGIVKLVHAPAATQTTAAPGVAPPLAAASPLPFGVDTLRVSLSVVDTLDASPRFFTMRHMFYALAGDSDVTIRVYDSSAWRFLGLDGVNVRRLVLHDSILYACTADYGLAWKNVYSDTAAWRYSTLPGPNGGDIHDLLVLDDSARTFLAVTGEQYTYLTPIYRSSSPDGPWLPADSGLSYVSHGKTLRIGMYRLAAFAGKLISVGGAVVNAYLPELVWTWRIVGGDYRVNLEQCHGDSSFLVFSANTPFQQDVIMYTRDTGSTWRALPLPRPRVGNAAAMYGIGLIPDHPGDVLLSTSDGYVRGTDYGNAWSDTITTYKHLINSFAFAPKKKGEVWAGSDGLLQSNDGGLHWVVLESIMALNTSINHLILGRAGSALFVGSTDGVFQLNIQGR